MFRRIGVGWLALAAILLALTPLADSLPRPKWLTTFFFRVQDAPVVAAISILAIRLLFLRPSEARWFAVPKLSPRLATFGLACAVLVIGLAGTLLIFDNYALSMDEYLANFDAQIFAQGRLMAPVPASLRGALDGFAPQFLLMPAHGAFWVSAYLPINAALRAFGGLLGLQALVSPGLAAIALMATYGAGRRLWPDRPRSAVIAALLLATSSQLLVTSMTAYAMTAHLAFNMVWLWLFVRGGRLGHGGAIAVGFLASGLHQFIFHPLFAAPFILQLWLERRFRAAIVYTLAYGCICLVWASYDTLSVAAALASAGASAGARDGSVAALGSSGLADMGDHRLAKTAVALLAAFDVSGAGLMAKNLIRLIAWQNPLTPPLVVLGAWGAFRAKGEMRSLILGIILTTLAMFVMLPYQGHGWGYRYLHGLLGSACLIAAWTWERLAAKLNGAERPFTDVVLGAACAMAMLVLFPLRLWQAHALVHPYAQAWAAIERAPTDFVFIDDANIWFGDDLTRTDPFFRNRPLVVRMWNLTFPEVEQLCAEGSISVFDQRQALPLGVRPDPARAAPRLDASRLAVLSRMACGREKRPIRDIYGAPL